VVGTVNFISRSFTRHWLTAQCCNEDVVNFLDVVSLLALIQDSSNSAFENVSFEGKFKAVGHSSRNEPRCSERSQFPAY
jgi:hypothetical protein